MWGISQPLTTELYKTVCFLLSRYDQSNIGSWAISYSTRKDNRSFEKEKMADPSVYSYPSPLEGWEGPALPEEKAADGKSELCLISTTLPNS
jgi:hypothetical protein